jgi:DNA-binding response OmpR family regulator
MWPFTKSIKIRDLKTCVPRDELLRSSRILILDDEEPALKADLENAGFTAQWSADVNHGLIQQIERMKYDLILLDFAGIGKSLGDQEGLDILRHVKRVAPAVIILSYTSKALKSKHADFYRLTDGVLPKDAGISDSLDKIETALRQAQSAENLWRALLNRIGVEPASKDAESLESKFVKASNKSDRWQRLLNELQESVKTDEGKAAALAIGRRLLQAIVAAATGA